VEVVIQGRLEWKDEVEVKQKIMRNLVEIGSSEHNEKE
jgi:hypothetical protein